MLCQLVFSECISSMCNLFQFQMIILYQTNFIYGEDFLQLLVALFAQEIGHGKYCKCASNAFEDLSGKLWTFLCETMDFHKNV